MSALMDQVYESEAASHPSPHRAEAPGDPAPPRGLEAPLIAAGSLAIAGLVFGFAIERFGWAGLLLATWPAFALAGGFGCLCHDLLQRVSRRGRTAVTERPLLMSKPDRRGVRDVQNQA